MTFDELFQYYADMGFGTQIVPQETQEGIASLITPAVSGVTPVISRGGDEYRGGGLFGNLDLSKAKTFTKDVYSDVLGPPGAFEFSPQEIQAYYNPTLGNYQTYEGLNVNPMFSNTGVTFGLFGGILNALGLQPKTVGGFVPQSIRGYYDTPKDFLTGNKNIQQMPQETKAEIRNIQQKLDKDYSGPGGGGGADMGGGRDNTGGDRGSAGAADRFSNTSGRGRTGY